MFTVISEGHTAPISGSKSKIRKRVASYFLMVSWLAYSSTWKWSSYVLPKRWISTELNGLVSFSAGSYFLFNNRLLSATHRLDKGLSHRKVSDNTDPQGKETTAKYTCSKQDSNSWSHFSILLRVCRRHKRLILNYMFGRGQCYGFITASSANVINSILT
jgi:hypothetical protein